MGVGMTFLDLDGTLIDSNGVWLNVDAAFAEKRGKAVTEAYAREMGRSIFPVAARITKEWYGLDESPEEIMTEWTELAYDAYAHTIPLKEGAVELLEKLKAHGEPTVLLTAGLPLLAKAAVDRHGLDKYFAGMFFAHDAGLEKRNPELYRIAAREYGVSPADCVLFDDSPSNCAAARAAGLTVIGVYDRFYQGEWAELQKNSDRAVRSLMELL